MWFTWFCFVCFVVSVLSPLSLCRRIMMDARFPPASSGLSLDVLFLSCSNSRCILFIFFVFVIVFPLFFRSPSGREAMMAVWALLSSKIFLSFPFFFSFPFSLFSLSLLQFAICLVCWLVYRYLVVRMVCFSCPLRWHDIALSNLTAFSMS